MCESSKGTTLTYLGDTVMYAFFGYVDPANAGKRPIADEVEKNGHDDGDPGSEPPMDELSRN